MRRFILSRTVVCVILVEHLAALNDVDRSLSSFATAVAQSIEPCSDHRICHAPNPAYAVALKFLFACSKAIGLAYRLCDCIFEL